MTNNSNKMGRPSRSNTEQPTDQKILDAAISLFSKHGYDRISVREIAGGAGISEGAIYRHFSGKEEILETIFNKAEQFIYTPLPTEETTDGESIFYGLLAPLPGIIRSNPQMILIMRIMYAEMYHDKKIQEYFLEHYGERTDVYLEKVFEKEIEKGRIIKCDAKNLARIFNAFRADWAFKTFLLERETPLSDEEILKDLKGPVSFFENLFLRNS
jgi:AcrR family transcriptional regulator